MVALTHNRTILSKSHTIVYYSSIKNVVAVFSHGPAVGWTIIVVCVSRDNHELS